MIDILLKDILKELNINRIVETGTDKAETIAETSRWFAAMDPEFGTIERQLKTEARSYRSWSVPIIYPIFSQARPSRYQIHSVDIDQYSYESAKKIFHSNPNIHLYHSSSEKFLTSLLNREIDRNRVDHNYLFFLDAHWGEYWPLRDELKIICKLRKYIIVIDDFMVPGKSNPSFPNGFFGFDIYKGQILNWSYICDLFTAVQVKIFYPSQPNRDHRGWVLITHGYSESELAFLKTLALFEINQFDKSHTLAVKPTWRSSCNARNILKQLVPISLLRSLYRGYEKIIYHFGCFFMPHKI